MSTTMDVYQPCPCGSGKKLKFCCAALAADMEKVKRLIEGKQYRTAMQALEAAEKKAPRNPWVLATKAQICMTESKPEEAKPYLEALLQDHPDHGEAALMYANCCYAVDGYEASLPAIQRALHRANQSPDLAALLTLQISDDQALAGRWLSARQYLTLGLKWVPDSLRQKVFFRLMEMEADRNIPYPYRSVHHLLPWKAGDEPPKDFGKALKLAGAGCWDVAARLFTQLGDQHPKVSCLPHNAALCKAWVGDEAAASRLFHEAARREDDRETAIEWETMAQLLGLESVAPRIRIVEKHYSTESVSRLLTRLSESPQLARNRDADDDDEEADAVGRPIASSFDVIDRPCPSVDEVMRSRIADLPRMIGAIRVYDAVPEKNLAARIAVQSAEPNFAECDAALTSAGGSELQPVDVDAGPTESSMAPQVAALERYYWLPEEGIPVGRRKQLSAERWRMVIDEGWAKTPQAELGGKTPQDAAGDPALSVPLAAAVAVLDVLTQQRSHQIDATGLCARFQLPPTAPIHPTKETEIQNFSAMQLHRLAVSELTDEQLVATLNRAILLSHQRFLGEAMAEAIRRPDLHTRLDMAKVFMTLVEIARASNRKEEALGYLRQAIEATRQKPDHFEAVMQMEMTEFSLRAEDPQDPELPRIVRHLYSYYARKVPQIEVVLDRLCQLYEVERPADVKSGESSLIGAGTTSAGGVWTPGAEAAARGGKKLWLPGQS